MPASVTSFGTDLLILGVSQVTLRMTAAGAEPANLDNSTTPPYLNVLDFQAFQNAFAAGEQIADFDGSGNLNVLDFNAYLNAFAAGKARLARWQAGVPVTPITGGWRCDGLWQPAQVIQGTIMGASPSSNWYGDLPHGAGFKDGNVPIPADPLFYPRVWSVKVLADDGAIALRFGGWGTVGFDGCEQTFRGSGSAVA